MDLIGQTSKFYKLHLFAFGVPDLDIPFTCNFTMPNIRWIFARSKTPLEIWKEMKEPSRMELTNFTFESAQNRETW